MHGLAPAEAGLARALTLLLAGSTPGFRWAFVHEGPFDALLVAAGSQPPAPARTVAALGERGQAPSPGMELLTRPLQADVLGAWLRRCEAGGSPGLRTDPAETPRAAEPQAAVLPPAHRVRLKRWPPAALLRGDPQRVRMATLLSRRPLSSDELAVLSAQPDDRCRTFLNLLQGFGLLESVAPTPAPAAPPAAVPPTAARLPSRGLIHSIRRRLGL